MARIGQLAGPCRRNLWKRMGCKALTPCIGQINRHRFQQPQAPAASEPSPGRRPFLHKRWGVGNTDAWPDNRYDGSRVGFYRSRGHRYGRRPGPRHHRSLQLNNAAPAAPDAEAGGDGSAPPGWVSKTDRHRQLINANVFERESQNRAKAIEQTRQAKLKSQRKQERARLKEFIRQQASVSATETAAGGKATQESNELVICGIRFRVMDRGRKLVRVQGTQRHSSAA